MNNMPSHDSTDYEKSVTKSDMINRIGVVVLFFTALIIIVLLSTVIVSISTTTDKIRTTQKNEAPSLGDIKNELLKCSSPGGECYKRNKVNQDKLIKYIVDVNTATEYCSKIRKAKTYEGLSSCVSSTVEAPK